MRETAERILTAILIILILPCAVTLLLNGRMERIYQAIKKETQYISVKSGSGTLQMELEEYVILAAAAQIPLGSDIEAVKAQMVLARTNICRQIQKNGEVRQESMLTMAELERAGAAEKFLKAEKATRKEILTWEDEPIMASYHALSAGNTRDAAEVFRSEEYPYLVSKTCPADESAPDFRSVIQIDEAFREMEIVSRDSAGYVQQVRLGEQIMSGEEFRGLLGLASSHFDIEAGDEGVFLTVVGAGHGLGMSQYTARSLAESGKSYREILDYFFPGTKLTTY